MTSPVMPEPTDATDYRAIEALERGDQALENGGQAAVHIRQSLQVLGQLQEDEVIPPEEEEKLKEFESMYQFERIKRPFGCGHLALLLYVPFGCVLLLLRMIALFLTALVLPRVMSEKQVDRYVHRLLCFITGTIVKVKDQHLLDPSNLPPLIVANHVSEFDALAVRWLCPAYVLGYDFYKNMLFFRLLGDKFSLLYAPYVSRNQGNANGRNQIREVIQQKLDKGDKPVICFPEGGLTNGKKGLLQYHKFLFSLGRPIQPLALRVTDGPFPVNINDETSTFVANVLWYFFIPWHVYTITVLPRSEAQPEEDALDFAQRVMKTTARSLDQQATAFLYRDKITFTRYKNRQMRRSARSLRSIS